ncbi:MAG: hypothetical protein OSB38_07355 [Paraburkholderia fungorum]|jgi:hypothetical protein|nr:hypothetical protein [Paraburkholderia fungorum]
MDTPDSWTKEGSPPKSKLHAVYGTSAKKRVNRLYRPDYRLLRSLPRRPIVRSIDQRAFPQPFRLPRTKAAQRRCTIMHVMCVKPVTSGKCGMKIAHCFRPITANHHPGPIDENLPLQSLHAPRVL